PRRRRRGGRRFRGPRGVGLHRGAVPRLSVLRGHAGPDARRALRQRVPDVRSRNAVLRSSPAHGGAVITVRGLSKEFQRRPVLHGLDLDVEPGERLALVGPNGSGKTTLLRCLLGLLSYKGTISVFGNDPLRDHVAVQRLLAYVPQRSPALGMPVRD